MEYNELNHHGVKGQKWGRRLYQYKDGSLTPLGRRHYAKVQRAEEKKKEAEAREKETVEEKRARLLKSTDANELYKNRELLTTAEINERINRIDTERRLGDVAAKTKKTGMDRVNKALEVGKKVDEVYSTVKNSAIVKSIKDRLNEGQTSVYDLDSAKKVLKHPEKQSSDALTKAKNYIDAYNNLKETAKKLDPKKSKKYTNDMINEILGDHGDYTVDEIKDLADYTQKLSNAKRNWNSFLDKNNGGKGGGPSEADVKSWIEEILDERNNK